MSNTTNQENEKKDAARVYDVAQLYESCVKLNTIYIRLVTNTINPAVMKLNRLGEAMDALTKRVDTLQKSSGTKSGRRSLNLKDYGIVQGYVGDDGKFTQSVKTISEETGIPESTIRKYRAMPADEASNLPVIEEDIAVVNVPVANEAVATADVLEANPDTTKVG